MAKHRRIIISESRMLLGAVQIENIPVPARIVLVLLLVAFGGWVIYHLTKDFILDWQTSTYGEPALGWIVQANAALFEKGRGNLPALVLVSPDDETARDEELMTALAERIRDLKDARGRTKDERYVSRLVTDERYIPGQRDKLPKSFTEGREVYAAHVLVQRAFLPKKRLVDPWVYCLIPWEKPGSPAWTISADEYKRRRRLARTVDDEDSDED